MQRNHIIDEFLDTMYDLDPIESSEEYLKAADHTHPILDDELVATSAEMGYAAKLHYHAMMMVTNKVIDKFQEMEKLDSMQESDPAKTADTNYFNRICSLKCKYTVLSKITEKLEKSIPDFAYYADMTGTPVDWKDEQNLMIRIRDYSNHLTSEMMKVDEQYRKQISEELNMKHIDDFEGNALHLVPATGPASQVYEAVDKYEEMVGKLLKTIKQCKWCVALLTKLQFDRQPSVKWHIVKLQLATICRDSQQLLLHHEHSKRMCSREYFEMTEMIDNNTDWQRQADDYCQLLEKQLEQLNKEGMQHEN